MVYPMVYTCLYGIHHGIYLLYIYMPWFIASIAFLPALNATMLLPFPGGHCRLWTGCWVEGSLAELCDDLPGFEAGDITVLLCDLPIPIPGDVPGMMVEEAIEV
jgi:hypothetical protein